MLALLGPRRLQYPLHSLRTRSLTYSHKPIPTYKTVWDHTHTPLRPQKLFTKWKWNPHGQVTKEDSTSKAERRQLRDAYLSRPIALVRRCDPINPHVNHTLKRLNHLIGLADIKRNDDGLRVKLWRAYTLAKHSNPDIPSIIPERAWDVLWATQSLRSLDNTSREKHMKELCHDRYSAGASVTVGERTAYLEDMFINGEEELALREWEDDHRRLDPLSRQDYRPEHLEIGARMYALAGNADRARDIMEDLFDLYPTWKSSVMITVFRAHTSTDSIRHHDLAKDLYIKMKAHLGKTATLEDYDAWMVGFLEARHLWYAMQIFGDMIKDGQLASKISPREVEKLLQRLHRLYHLGTDIQKMTNIALYVISILPRAWHSELYGHWMQAATVKQAPEVAIQLLEMMFTRGSIPQTFHFNLLLRNLLQTKDRERELRAENIGWHMIEVSRKAAAKKGKPTSEPTVGMIRQVSKRPTDMDIISEKIQKATEATKNADRSRKFPPADTITFALVMRHHANHLQWEHVDYLARRIKEQGLLPNSTILNVLMENQIRQGKYSRAWEIHKSFTNVAFGTRRVFPDGANFRCLWLALRLALGDHETRYDSALPTPRRLLAETIQWWEMTRNRSDAERFRIGLASGDHDAVTSLMMHCFSYTQDLPGSLVALHALRKRIDIFPSDKAADVLQRQVAWVDLTRATNETRAQYSKSGTRQSVEKMGQIYQMLKQNRFKRMGLTSDQFASMSKVEIGDLNLNLLSEFIRVILKRQHPPEKVEVMIEEARKEIGLPDLATGDMNAFSVA